VEHVRVEVESVGPDDRTQLRVDADLVEDGRVAEPLAHRTPHIGGEVDDSFAAVIEDQTELVAVEGLARPLSPGSLDFDQQERELSGATSDQPPGAAPGTQGLLHHHQPSYEEVAAVAAFLASDAARTMTATEVNLSGGAVAD
jgi:hypothetical protein